MCDKYYGWECPFWPNPPLHPICKQPLKDSSWIGLNKEWEKRDDLQERTLTKFVAKDWKLFWEATPFYVELLKLCLKKI